jgi:hypothetical protein
VCPRMRRTGPQAPIDAALLGVVKPNGTTGAGGSLLARAEETDTGLRELDPSTGEVVGLEFWQASRELPADFLRMLPPPQVGVAA